MRNSQTNIEQASTSQSQNRQLFIAGRPFAANAARCRLPKAGLPPTRKFEMSLSLAAKKFIRDSPCGVSSVGSIKRLMPPQHKFDHLAELVLTSVDHGPGENIKYFDPHHENSV